LELQRDFVRVARFECVTDRDAPRTCRESSRSSAPKA
jgi:hypothetical protein